MSLLSRFEASFIPEPNSGCWLWLGSISRSGYGNLYVGEHRRPKQIRAHQAAWELYVGPVMDGFELDHLCRVRCCVNPAHLEPVTHVVNLYRGNTIPAMKAAQTHCVHGHEFTVRNTRIQRNGTRLCRTCHRNRERLRGTRIK